jgi:SpoIIAA-like
MIKELSDLPVGVVGFEATGTLKAEDYRDVVLPALEQAFASGEVRFVIVMPEFHGMSGGAMWQDLKVGIEHFRAWKRIALVTDIDWMRHMTELFGWMTPGEVKVFPLAQRGEAIAWAAGNGGAGHQTTDRSA